MLEKLKGLLGEELSKQVEEKIGSVELAIMNDGSVVNAEKHDTLKKEFELLDKRYKEETSVLNTRLEDAIKTSGDVEVFKKSIEDLKAEQQKIVDENTKSIENIKIDSAIEIELTKENTRNTKAAKALLDRSKISIVDGQVTGIKEQVMSLKASDDYLFGEIIQKGGDPAKSKEQKLTDTYADRYVAAMKSGNNKEAIKIKQEAFEKGEII